MTTTSMLFGVTRRAAIALGAAAALVSTSAMADDWPSSPITIVVPFNAGGSADRMARSLAGPMGEVLGQPVVVENRPGGAGGLGATYVAQQPADGNTLLLMQATPYLANAILVGGAPVAWNDFAFLNAQWDDYAIVAVHKDSPYKTFQQMIEAMQVPGKVSSGIIHANGGHLQTLLVMNAFGIPHDNVRFVTYDGGGPLRAALAGNQVDFEVLAAQGADSIMDSLRVLAIVNDEDRDGMEAPLMNSVLSEMGIEPLPIIGGNVTGLLVRAAMKDEHPERFERLLSAYEVVVTSEGYRAAAAEGGLAADWVGHEVSQRMVDEAYTALEGLKDIIQ